MKVAGLAHLCFIPETTECSQLGSFQGHVIDLTQQTTLGVVAYPAESPPPIHACCISPGSEPQFFDVVLQDYYNGKKAYIRNVHQTNSGDAIELATAVDERVAEEEDIPQLQFATSTLKSGEDAVKHLIKFMLSNGTTGLPHFNVQWDFAIDLDSAIKEQSQGSSFWLSLYNFDGKKSLHTKVNCFANRLEVEEPVNLKAKIVDEKSFLLADAQEARTLIQSPATSAKLAASINDLNVSPSGSLIIVGGDDGLACVLDAQDLSRRIVLRGLVGDISVARFFPSGKVALTAGQDLTAKVWNLESLEVADDGPSVSKPAQILAGHHGTITDVEMIDRGRNIFSCAKDGFVRLWEVGSAACIWQVSPFEKLGQNGHVNSVFIGSHDSAVMSSEGGNPLEFGTEGKFVIVGCDNGLVSLYDIRSRTEIFSYKCKSSSANVTSACLLQSKSLVGVAMVYEGSCPLVSFDGNANATVRIEFAGVDVEPIKSFDYTEITEGLLVYTGGRDGIVRKYRTLSKNIP
ncbi:hypothetical protein HDU67_009592 [Dinochytrium kinnereticum]|nr:hypothetical protein HDU67_009592 [Dinochytrium kinnereticum]